MNTTAFGVSSFISDGIHVFVKATYLANQSDPRLHRYVFAYTIQISNEGKAAAQLLNRHWIITNGAGEVEEVRGPGVVGKQPLLQPGERFEYTSGVQLETPRGSMRGTYEMVRPDGTLFNATIAQFELSLPRTLN